MFYLRYLTGFFINIANLKLYYKTKSAQTIGKTCNSKACPMEKQYKAVLKFPRTVYA